MSKNKKHYHNYNSYSSNNAKTEEQVADTEGVVEEVSAVEEIEQVEEEVVEAVEAEVTEEVKETAPVVGVVTDCPRLRVRKGASTDTDVVCEIDAGSEVAIDESASTNDFYKVCTAAGFEGFCMKRFITVQ